MKFKPQIINVLKRVQRARCLLKVMIPGHSGTYNSALLHIDGDQSLTLDELQPPAGHAALMNAGQCRVRAELKGVTVSFTTNVLAGENDPRGALYHLALPDRLSYRQRRKYYRSPVALSQGIRVVLQLPGGDKKNVDLYDISGGGLALRHKCALPGIKVGDILPCHFELDQDECIDCELEVRFLLREPSPRLGGRFHQITPAHRRRIERFARRLERQALKQQAR
ncbi:MAG TPA: hypothetical protein ENJ19_02990 [Gammaproteobacteria bacterium]|nr:hypothetical protein [Gammaproteobacteria bacterium]